MITTIRHPRSGETYAVEIYGDIVVRAAGPLHYSDPTDWASLAQAIANAGTDAEDDGAWLQSELDAAVGA